MSESLLASLYTRFKCSQEDVATLSLRHILSSSESMRSSFNRYMAECLEIEIESGMKYFCQQSGKSKERPDMSGFDSNGNEVILFEMKFYAGLTDNQPMGYLERLKNNSGNALVFVCPKSRKSSLWSKIKGICKEQGKTFSYDKDFRVIVDEITMSIISWDSIIKVLKDTAVSEKPEIKSDLDQLAGLCSFMDSSAFIPFSPEDFDPMVARKEDRYYQVIEALSKKMKDEVSRKPVLKGKVRPYRGGYSREIHMDGYDTVIIYDRILWMKEYTDDSPFWLYIAENNGVQSEKIKAKLRELPAVDTHFMKYTNDNIPPTLYDSKKGDFYLIALHPLVHATLEEVADDMMKQVLQWIDYIKE